MAKYTVFQKPVSRAKHRAALVRMAALMVVSGLRHVQIHRRTQINLVRNRHDISWGHSMIRGLIAQYGGAL